MLFRGFTGIVLGQGGLPSVRAVSHTLSSSESGWKVLLLVLAAETALPISSTVLLFATINIMLKSVVTSLKGTYCQELRADDVDVVGVALDDGDEDLAAFLSGDRERVAVIW